MITPFSFFPAFTQNLAQDARLQSHFQWWISSIIHTINPQWTKFTFGTATTANNLWSQATPTDLPTNQPPVNLSCAFPTFLEFIHYVWVEKCGESPLCATACLPTFSVSFSLVWHFTSNFCATILAQFRRWTNKLGEKRAWERLHNLIKQNLITVPKRQTSLTSWVPLDNVKSLF